MGILKKIWGTLNEDFHDSLDSHSSSSSTPSYSPNSGSEKHTCYDCEYYVYHGCSDEGCHCNYYNEDEYGFFGDGKFKRYMEESYILYCECPHFARKD